MSCPTCQGRGHTTVTAVAWHPHVTQGQVLLPTYLPVRCRCGAGFHAPGLREAQDQLEVLRRPSALVEWPTLVDVVELEAPWGRAYARALGTLLSPGERVEGHHRDMAWRAVQAARAPMTDAEIRQMPVMEAA